MSNLIDRFGKLILPGEREVGFSIFPADSKVQITFTQPVPNLAFDVETARRIAEAILLTCDHIEGKVK